MSSKNEKIGYACAYAPLVLIDAAGYTPYRILPMSACPDQAGQLLHDNLCPHVKRILDRAIGKDLPEYLEGPVNLSLTPQKYHRRIDRIASEAHNPRQDLLFLFFILNVQIQRFRACEPYRALMVNASLFQILQGDKLDDRRSSHGQ